MTHAEQILRAAVVLTEREGKETFSRDEIRRQIGVDRDEWMAGYTAIFQGMRVDEPGGAPNVGEAYKGMFQRVAHGKYVLTAQAREWIRSNR